MIIARSTPRQKGRQTSVRSTSSVTRAPALRRNFGAARTQPQHRERLDARVHAGQHRKAARCPGVEPAELETVRVPAVRLELGREDVVLVSHVPLVYQAVGR